MLIQIQQLCIQQSFQHVMTLRLSMIPGPKASLQIIKSAPATSNDTTRICWLSDTLEYQISLFTHHTILCCNHNVPAMKLELVD